MAFTKKGHSFVSFQSNLPGGHDGKNHWPCRLNATLLSAKTTILDCVLDREAKKFYVLDMICWGSMPFEETEFSCRLFFLQSKLAEDPSLAKATRRRPYTFHALPYCNCTVDDMTRLMQQKFEFTVDGLLFFHSQVLQAFATRVYSSVISGSLRSWSDSACGLAEAVDASGNPECSSAGRVLPRGAGHVFVEKLYLEIQRRAQLQERDQA